MSGCLMRFSWARVILTLIPSCPQAHLSPLGRCSWAWSPRTGSHSPCSLAPLASSATCSVALLVLALTWPALTLLCFLRVPPQIHVKQRKLGAESSGALTDFPQTCSPLAVETHRRWSALRPCLVRNWRAAWINWHLFLSGSAVVRSALCYCFPCLQLPHCGRLSRKWYFAHLFSSRLRQPGSLRTSDWILPIESHHHQCLAPQ